MIETTRARLGIILPRELRIALRQEAAQRDTTITQVVVEALREYLRRTGQAA